MCLFKKKNLSKNFGKKKKIGIIVFQFKFLKTNPTADKRI